MMGCHQPSERFNGTIIPFAWFAKGLRLIDIADPYKPKEVGFYEADAPEGFELASSNDVTIDDRRPRYGEQAFDVAVVRPHHTYCHFEGGLGNQVVKKRIDKVHVLDTGERLTQPGKVAIIYLNEKEAEEYKGYIRYLQEKELLKEEVEELALEELQGVSGLRALRVSVKF